MLDTLVVDLEPQTKTMNKYTDLVSEYNRYMKHKYKNYKHIYTDGSKDPVTGNTGSAVVVPRGMRYADGHQIMCC